MSPKNDNRRPANWRVLMEAIGQARDDNFLFTFLSEGIKASISNADSLATDLSVLIKHKRSAAAQFIHATCMEEIGKAVILFDLVRADCRQNGRLKLLCKAFYSHLNKYGYAKVLWFPGSGRIDDALALYKLELIEYWPNRDPENGEPDMPADAIAHREWAIYVDWSEFDGRWFFPPDSSLAKFLFEVDMLEEVPPSMEQVRLTCPRSLYQS